MSVITATTERLRVDTEVGLRLVDVVRTAGLRDNESAAATIASISRTIVTRPLSATSTDVVARAAALLANGGTIAVVSDMATPGALYWKLHDAGHRGNVRLIAAQKADRLAALLADDDVLVVDLDGISCPSSSVGVEATFAAAATHRRVLVTGHNFTRGLDRCINHLVENSPEPFALVNL